MITFECCRCHEEQTEVNPHMWGECYPYYKGEPACLSCVDNYNGPDDDYYQDIQESALSYNQRIDINNQNSQPRRKYA